MIPEKYLKTKQNKKSLGMQMREREKDVSWKQVSGSVQEALVSPGGEDLLPRWQPPRQRSRVSPFSPSFPDVWRSWVLTTAPFPVRTFWDGTLDPSPKHLEVTRLLAHGWTGRIPNQPPRVTGANVSMYFLLVCFPLTYLCIDGIQILLCINSCVSCRC